MIIAMSMLFNYENPDSPPFSTDIIGVLEDFERVKPIQTMYGERNIVKFRITDGRYSHKVSVWGQLAVTITHVHEKIVERPIMAIVTSSKLKIFKSSVQISTLPSSKIYLNLDNDYVNAYKSRLEEEGYKVSENVVGSPTHVPLTPPVIQTITLSELSEKTNTDDLKMMFLCAVTINAVEETGNWWYNSCIDCQSEVFKLDGRFKCLKCPKNLPVPEKRYKIIVLAGDSTEAFNFILYDRPAKRIIGQTVTKMIADNKLNEASSGFPLKIKEITGKEFILKVRISDDNVLLKSKIFDVVDAYDSSYSTPSPTEPTISGFTVSSFAENMVDLSKCDDTPGEMRTDTVRSFAAVVNCLMDWMATCMLGAP
ncbi:hypothetical protein POM88_051731 [Heracleum sosnowskyi]|uniref:Replication factor A C-terminal domain-containing protein n=1 Tax=Heracleum sosnowskyi TaxID=360622 RepID=A0AAD8H046_9APIA|nr:hypothetical protein POM88_051731 [Heracleum sosnowskyi]